MAGAGHGGVGRRGDDAIGPTASVVKLRSSFRSPREGKRKRRPTAGRPRGQASWSPTKCARPPGPRCDSETAPIRRRPRATYQPTSVLAGRARRARPARWRGCPVPQGRFPRYKCTGYHNQRLSIAGRQSLADGVRAKKKGHRLPDRKAGEAVTTENSIRGGQRRSSQMITPV